MAIQATLGASTKKALVFCERLRSAIMRLDGVSASIGISSYFADHHELDLLSSSDQAMYAAKRNGRNRVECESQLIAAEQCGDLQPQD